MNKYNLPQLEDDLQASYDSFVIEKNQTTQTNLYLDINKLAFAILSVSKSFKHLQNHENIAYEYSLYLFERILLKKFMPKSYNGDRFPWQLYMSKNIKHVAYNIRDDFFWRDQIKDMEFLVGDEQSMCNFQKTKASVDNNNHLSLANFSDKLLKSLNIFYKIDEINRLLPLCSELILNKNKSILNNKDTPKDIKDFSTILLALTKRLSHNEEINLSRSKSKIFTSSLRSSIFLSAISNAKIFPKELFLSLDVDSLYRLAHLCGGKLIKIPTEKDLNTLLGAVVSVSKIIQEGKKIKRSVFESKNEFNLMFSKGINLESFMSNIMKSMDIFKEDQKTDPLILVVLNSLKNINYVLKDLSKKDIKTYYPKLKRIVKDLRETLENIERKFDA